MAVSLSLSPYCGECREDECLTLQPLRELASTSVHPGWDERSGQLIVKSPWRCLPGAPFRFLCGRMNHSHRERQSPLLISLAVKYHFARMFEGLHGDQTRLNGFSVGHLGFVALAISRSSIPFRLSKTV